MKISSNSSYSSSSSSSKFDPPAAMCNNSKNGTSGCFNAILRRILCSGGLPTHPSDQIRDFDSNSILGTTKDQNFNAKKHHAKATTSSVSSSGTTTTTTATTTTTTTPGIVARLMGLDSMVDIPSNSSLLRSKSMNSVDCLGECNRMDGLHKRVKSTLSFREVPTFFLLENENFFVLSFEKKKNDKSIGKKREMGYGGEELKEKKRENVKSSKSVANGKLQEITNTCYYEKSRKKNKNKKCFDSEARKLSQPRILMDDGVRMKRRRGRKRSNSKCEFESKPSEDTSPVSVLDFQKREACGTANSNSRRKLSPELDENDQKILWRSDGNLMAEEGKSTAIESNKCEEGSKKKEKHVKNWDEICMLAKEDELAWMNNNKQDGDLGSISADFASHIFDQLLNEVIHQLLVEDP
ncbi:uncharacterized protein LOC130943427 [Arachis stenosperma]|uniref:uncharacterized protein LOC130943427 n=1 Tax=Arachis stenosperma TaxID=217475 RepID=UPI0025ABE39B|nr:uncharacterized protein LOC130943427 [Arachis stenosperma]